MDASEVYFPDVRAEFERDVLAAGELTQVLETLANARRCPDQEADQIPSWIWVPLDRRVVDRVDRMIEGRSPKSPFATMAATSRDSFSQTLLLR